MSAKLPTILDNRNDNTVLNALKRLLPESKNLDVATGYFEIGSLLALDSFWNSLEKIRIVMGDETTKRTKRELEDAVKSMSDESIEREKEKDDSLRGLSAIRESLLSGHIGTKVYTKAKFHAKAMLMQLKPPHLSNYGIVGSSNFTEPGLCKNIELNLLSTEQHQLDALQKWYQECWNESEEIRDVVLRVIEPHLKEYLPFEVYAKALYEFFIGKEMPATSWEENESKVYPQLDDLNKAGYKQALKIAEEWGGALICDGVGFGKTYIGLMLIERFLHERKRVALIVPKSTRESVWEKRLKEYLNFQPMGRGYTKQLLILNHTDLHRNSPDILADLDSIQKEADVILVDEGHHFRTPSAQRSQKLYELIEWNKRNKPVFFLTATPINNSLYDILHLIEYFSRRKSDYFQKLGIPNLRSDFIKKEKAVEAKMGLTTDDNDGEEALFPDFDIQEAEKILRQDKIFQALVIQRSRDYARKYFAEAGGGKFYFPTREDPYVAEYKLAKIYGDLFTRVKASFNKENPFLELSLYNTENKKKEKEKIDKGITNREKQVIMLIRATMLKRMESSYKAFESSCEDLLRSNARFLRHYAPGDWEDWKKKNETFWDVIEKHWKERFQDVEDIEEVEEDDILPPPKEELDPQIFKLDEIAADVKKDLNELVSFLTFIHKNLDETKDDKLGALIVLLKEKPLDNGKVLIFTQYRDTARYLFRELKKRLPSRSIEEIDSTSKKDREEIIKRFAPYYNCKAEERAEYLAKPIDVLISTDVLSEGLNLQDASLLINYDLHWNPVRLMQRIGRVDRRLDADIEKAMGRDRDVVKFWNFLPPDELDELLKLYQKVSRKVLRISKTLGIEGGKLLRPEEELEPLRIFNAQYDGIRTVEENMHLALTEMLKSHPELSEILPAFPKRLFSGRKHRDQHPLGVFAAYRFPSRTSTDEQGNTKTVPGICRWYFCELATKTVLEDLGAVNAAVQAMPETPRVVVNPMEELRKSLALIEQQCVRKELKNMNALIGEKATLVCWMEVS
ncbi:MAG: helicase-related protein [Bacteroidota bacterium]